MRCGRIRKRLATYRELGRSERQEVQMHLATCGGCGTAWESYRAQDRLLAGLAEVNASKGWAAATLERAKAPRYGNASQGRLAPVLLAACILFVVSGLAVGVSAEALPGDTLYPLKRAREEARLSLTVNQEARLRYQVELRERRREEVGEVLRLGRRATVRFEGHLRSANEDTWVVENLPVQVGGDVWREGIPFEGSVVVVLAQADGGRLQARTVELREGGWRHRVSGDTESFVGEEPGQRNMGENGRDTGGPGHQDVGGARPASGAPGDEGAGHALPEDGASVGDVIAQEGPGNDGPGPGGAANGTPGNDSPGNDEPGNVAPGNVDSGNADPGNQSPGNNSPGNEAPAGEGAQNGNSGSDAQGDAGGGNPSSGSDATDPGGAGNGSSQEDAPGSGSSDPGGSGSESGSGGDGDGSSGSSNSSGSGGGSGGRR